MRNRAPTAVAYPEQNRGRTSVAFAVSEPASRIACTIEQVHTRLKGRRHWGLSLASLVSFRKGAPKEQAQNRLISAFGRLLNQFQKPMAQKCADAGCS